MITFLRKIRQNLLSEGKTRKYLKYAIGEIVLVTIGILIALQINNWNQKRINNNKEVTILNSLKTEFEENSNRYTKTIRFQKQVVKHMSSLLQCLEKKDITFMRDSIGIYITGGALNYYRAEPVLGTYEALNGSGDINLIKNELLKSKLASFSSEIVQGFEDEIATMDLLNILTIEFSPSLEPLMLTKYRQSFGLKNTRNTNVDFQNKTLLKMYQNPNIMTPLMRRILMENNRLELQNKMLKLSKEILELIDNEIE